MGCDAQHRVQKNPDALSEHRGKSDGINGANQPLTLAMCEVEKEQNSNCGVAGNHRDWSKFEGRSLKSLSIKFRNTAFTISNSLVTVKLQKQNAPRLATFSWFSPLNALGQARSATAFR